jgi:hypothetical protein
MSHAINSNKKSGLSPTSCDKGYLPRSFVTNRIGSPLSIEFSAFFSGGAVRGKQLNQWTVNGY